MPAVRPRDRVVYKGTIAVPLLATAQVVTFATPMPNTYDLYFRTPSGITVTGVSAQTATGFTLSLGITLAGNLLWVAVEQMG